MAKKLIDGKVCDILGVGKGIITIPDCFVLNKNKIGKGNGEAKLYISSKADMYDFYGEPGFAARCVMLRTDLLNYMDAIRCEYVAPTQEYRGKDEMAELWTRRYAKIAAMPEVIEFTVHDQKQIEGPRGYVNASDAAYTLIREISLPLVSYLSSMKLADPAGGTFYYWRLFVDFDMMDEIANGPLVHKYGMRKDAEPPKAKGKKAKDEAAYRAAREGQGKYREDLLSECPYCPITKITDERLLIASHIKPYAASVGPEKIDPKNGFMLSPMFDKLFDRGFITFDEKKHVRLSNWLSPTTYKLIGIKDGDYFPMLPLDDKRNFYLEYHWKAVFKG